jgi:hypothetical protein
MEGITDPSHYLRMERMRRLIETDEWALSDRTMTAEQTAYRKALRDLPDSADPKWSTEEGLTNVTWPTRPYSKASL